MFTPDSAFETVVKKKISRLKEPCLQFVDMVSQELMTTARQCTSQVQTLTSAVSVWAFREPCVSLFSRS